LTIKLEPQIIYEDKDVLVINKPAGLSVHGDGINKEETLVDWLIKKYPEIEKVGEGMLDQKGEEIKKPGIVHRLDKDTSGVMIIAKTQRAFFFLKEQFQNHKANKVYRAILDGALKMERGEERVINQPIGRSKNDPRRRVASAKAAGPLREAVTTFRLIENICDQYAYVEAEPKTGRTHQLRVHFKAYGHPLIGDSLYNPKVKTSNLIGHQALHAYQLTVTLLTSELKTFTAPLPEDFTQALEKAKLSC